jgi:hypothetical protein
MTLAAICNQCDGKLNEGVSAYYDNKRELHYCTRSCFDNWCIDHAEVLAAEYRREHCERVDL